MPAGRLRIVVLSWWFPFPPVNGSKLRAFQILETLAAEHDVTLLSFTDSAGDLPEHPRIVELCRAIEVWPRPSFVRDSWRARLALFRGSPRWIVETESPPFAARVQELLDSSGFDIVVALQLGAARYVPRRRQIRALVEEIELAGLYEQLTQAPSAWQRARYGLTWLKHRRYLRRLLQRFDACTVVSEPERRLLLSAVPSAPAVHVIPNAIEIPPLPCRPRLSHRLMFNGTLVYEANRDALAWFVELILPRVRAQHADIELCVTGDGAQSSLMGAPGVSHLGIVPDVHEALAAAAVAVVPVRRGGGTRFKILDAFAAGTPVVSTRKGAEGLNVRDQEHLLLADTPEVFAGAIVRLLDDPQLAARLACNGRRLVEAEHDWAVSGQRLLTLVEQLAGGEVKAVA
jgi:glycosyltransferase involved in cell wall biosynthesis